MLTGWQKVNGIWYYLCNQGSMTIGWQQVNGNWYHLGDNGAMDTGLFLDKTGKLYYLAADGYMCRTDASGALV